MVQPRRCTIIHVALPCLAQWSRPAFCSDNYCKPLVDLALLLQEGAVDQMLQLLSALEASSIAATEIYSRRFLYNGQGEQTTTISQQAANLKSQLPQISSTAVQMQSLAAGRRRHLLQEGGAQAADPSDAFVYGAPVDQSLDEYVFETAKLLSTEGAANAMRADPASIPAQFQEPGPRAELCANVMRSQLSQKVGAWQCRPLPPPVLLPNSLCGGPVVVERCCRLLP